MQVTDPVCGMRIDAERAVGQAEWNGTTYYFCGTGCHAAFEREPARFAESEDGARTRGAWPDAGGART